MKFLAIIFLFLLICFPQKILAANPFDVVLNEIAWMGTETASQDEWIELYNNTGSAIDLSGWKLISQDGTPEINLSGSILANGFFLLERTDDTTVPNIPTDQIYKGALENSGEHLKLFDDQGNLIDEANFSGGWPAGDNNTKQTMERKNPKGSGNDASNWQTSQNPGGTPKAQNSPGQVSSPPPGPVCQPTEETCDGIDNDCDGQIDEGNVCAIPEPPTETQPPTYPSGIFINEFLPSPEGPDTEEEFIELYNSNPTNIDISGWSIQDTQGSPKIYTFPNGANIPGSGFLVLKRPISKIVLNNNGEGLVLKNPLGDLVDSVVYKGEAPQGQSYARKADGTWEWSLAPSPGKANSFPSPKKAKPEAEVRSEPEPEPEAQIETQPKIQPQEEPIIYPAGVVINEILPSPTGPDAEEEWIEVFNSNNFEVDISGWQIQDIKGKTKTYNFPRGTKIRPNGFLVLSRPTTKIALNNDGDGLNLIQPDGKIADSVTFGKAPQGQSYNRVDSDWFWSDTLTPGSTNIVPVQAEEETEEETKKNGEIQEKGLAAISQPFPKSPRSFFVFFIAIIIAIFSGIIILFLKKKVKKIYNKNI